MSKHDADAYARALLDGCAKWGKQTGLYEILVEAVVVAISEARREAFMEAAKVADEYPLRDPAEDGTAYWAAEEIAKCIRGQALRQQGESLRGGT